MIAHNMYAYNDNSTLRLMGSLPVRLRLPDGLTRTNLDELTAEQLAKIGIYPATEVRPEYDPATQYLGEPKLDFNGKAVTATYPVVDKTSEQIALEVATAKSAKLAEIAEARWKAETGGLTLPDGTQLKTDRESQALLTGASLFALQNASSTVEWKGVNGWVTLTATEIMQIATLVRNHVQAAFSKERDYAEKVNGCGTVEEVGGVVWG
jgi:hypothetical protein